MQAVRSKLALIIPTLNEAGNIPALLKRLQSTLEDVRLDYELIIVDDDSQDGTPELVQAYARNDPRVRLLVRKGQRGLAGAVIYGWKHTDATLLGVIDADLQHPPELLPQLLDAIFKGHDIAIASRYTAYNHGSVSEWSKVRHFISRCSTWATRPIQRKGVRVSDPMSGYFVLRRECVEGLNLQPRGFKILLEILVKGNLRNVAEIPFRFATRQAGKSKANLRVAIDYLSLLGKLSRYAIFRPGER
jgi:dolichol-phosphate mannosyltransferase